jgi:hypothetical protein
LHCVSNNILYQDRIFLRTELQHPCFGLLNRYYIFSFLSSAAKSCIKSTPWFELQRCRIYHIEDGLITAAWSGHHIQDNSVGFTRERGLPAYAAKVSSNSNNEFTMARELQLYGLADKSTGLLITSASDLHWIRAYATTDVPAPCSCHRLFVSSWRQSTWSRYYTDGSNLIRQLTRSALLRLNHQITCLAL